MRISDWISDVCSSDLRNPAQALRAFNFQYLLDHFVDADAGGVDADGAFGRSQRRHRAAGVAGFAGANVASQNSQCKAYPLVLQLLIAPFNTLLGTCLLEDLVPGIRAAYRATGEAVGNPARQRGEPPLAG